MEEVTGIPPSITLSHKSLLFSIPLDHASTAPTVRPCLELTRSCIVDLEELIKLCNENLPLMRTKPAVFRRTNDVIESARSQVSQVCHLLERMATSGRPGSSASHDDHGSDGQGGGQVHMSFKNRWGRLSTDARNLISTQQPLVAKEQGAVLNELNFMRQLVLIAPSIVNGPGPGLGPTASTGEQNGQPNRSKTTVWNNMGLLDEIIGGGGGGVRPKTPQQLQQTYIYPSPRPGPGDNLLLPPPYPGTPGLESKLKLPTLHHPSSSLSLLSNVPRPSSTNASSTTLWSPTTDPSFQELPCTETGATASQPINNAYIRPNTAIHKPSPSRTIFDQVGVGLLYGDGRDHTKSPSLQTSTSTSPRSELPELGPGPVTATTTRNTLIYNNQHTHNHNYQCHHHHHHHHHNNHNYQSQNQNYNQMGGMPQQQQPQPQPQYGCNCAWQKGNVNVRVVTAINEGEPQELSSVMTSPEPVELP